MSSRSTAGNLENVDLSEWNLTQDESSSEKNPFLQLSHEEFQRLNAVLSSEQAKLLLETELASSSLNFTMSRSSMSFAEGKSMGVIDSMPGHELLVDDMPVEMTTEVFCEDYAGDYDLSRRIILEHSYCLVPIPDQDIEVQVISEIETTEKIGDDMISINDIELENDCTQEFKEIDNVDAEIEERNTTIVEPNLNNAQNKTESTLNSGSVEKILLNEVKESENDKQEDKMVTAEDKIVEQTIKEVEQDVRDIESANMSTEQNESVPSVRRSRRQLERQEREHQLEKSKSESAIEEPQGTENVVSEAQPPSKMTEIVDESVSAQSVSEVLKLNESILDINDAVDVLLKIERSGCPVSPIQLSSMAMPTCSSAVTVEKLFTADLQPSLDVPNDIFDVTPDSLPVSDENASIDNLQSTDAIYSPTYESKSDEPKRTGMLTDDLFGRVVCKKPGEVVKKSVPGLSSGERKSYPKRENRKPPGYLMTVFEPELFSKPDKMKKIELRSDSMGEKQTSHSFESDSQPADEIEEFLFKAEGVDESPAISSLKSSELSDVEKKEDVQGIVKRKKPILIRKGGIRKNKRMQKGQKRKPIRIKGKSDVKQENSDDDSENSEDEDGSDDWCSEDDPDRLWCICKQPHNDRFMIGCDRCEDWFHGSCVGVTRKQGRDWEKSGKEWICKKCEKEIKEGKPKEQSIPLKTDTDKSDMEGKPLEEKKLSEKRFKDPASILSPKKMDSISEEKPKINFEKKIVTQAASTSDASTQLCIMGCGKPARPNSIFCSNECILQHADESLKMIGKDKERQKLSKLAVTQSDSSTKFRPASKRVPVINRRTGVIFQGIKAPFEKDLSLWLKQHPTFEVLNSSKFKKHFGLSRKTIKLITAQPMPSEQAESPKGKVAVSRSLMEEKKPVSAEVKNKQVVAELKSPTDGKVSHDSKGHGVLNDIKSPSVVKLVVDRKLSSEQKTSSESKLKLIIGKPKSPAIKRPSVDGKKPPSAEFKPTPVSPPAAVGPEPVRLSVRQTLNDCLANRSKDADDLSLSLEEIKQISVNIEDELFRLFNDVGTKYKAKYRSLIFNIKDMRNPGLFRKILQGKISPHKLVRMTAEELASKELAMWREREAKHSLEMIKREQEEQMMHAPLIKKTHKGDVEIDGPGFSERPKPKVELGPEPPPSLLTDTTESHRSHLFDLNCKICTGKLIPSSDDEQSKRSGSNVSKNTAETVEKDNDDGSLPEREECAEEEKIEETNIVKDDTDSKEVTKVAPKKEKSSLKKKDGVKKEKSGDANKKKVKKVRIQKVAFVTKIQSESCDREPSSTVTINSPDSACANYNEDFNSKSPSVWKGFITMQDVAKFVTNAYKVSGPTDFLNQDIPDTIQVCGRITPSIVWDYLSKVKHSGNKEFLVIRFAPANEEEKVSYISFYSYLSSRSRFGVVGNSSRIIKDFYILPLSAQDPVPATLLPFDGPGFDEPRPHMLLGIIIRHRGKRKQDAGDSKSKRTDSLELSMDADDVTEVIATKKVKFDLSDKGKDDEIPYEPSYTPPLVAASKKKRRKKSSRSTTPPLNQMLGKSGDSNSPYSPSRSGPLDDDDDNKPYDPEEAAEDGKVSKSLIPGLLSGSVSSQSVSELIDQISMSSNPAEITTTVLASIATATNLEQQRKLLIELTQKVEEQKRQLEMQKQQIANKVTAQVMGVIPGFTTMPLPSDTIHPLGIQSLNLPSQTSNLNVLDAEEAYSPSYTPPLQTSVSYEPEQTSSSLKLPDTSNISLPPNLQEILESIKKQGAASTAKEESIPVKMVNVMLEDPIVKNFADMDPGFADDDLSRIPVPSSPKAVVEDAGDVTKMTEEDGSTTPPPLLQAIKSRDPRQQNPRKQMDPRMKGKVQPEIGKIRKKVEVPPVGQKKGELSGLSAAELLEKAMKQFDDDNITTPEDTETSENSNNPNWPKFGKIAPIAASVPASDAAADVLESGIEPPPPGMEISSEGSEEAFLPESIPLPSIPLPPTPVVNYPVPPHHHPFLGPPPPFMGPPPPGFIPSPQSMFPGYPQHFPPPHMPNKGGGNNYWSEDAKKGEWRGGRGGGGSGRSRGRGGGGGRTSRWDRGGNNNNNSNWNRGPGGGNSELRTFNDYSSKDKDERGGDWPAPGQRDRDDRFRERREDRDNRTRERNERREERDRSSRDKRDDRDERDRSKSRDYDRRDRDWDKDKNKDRDRGRSRRRD